MTWTIPLPTRRKGLRESKAASDRDERLNNLVAWSGIWPAKTLVHGSLGDVGLD
jgi:hypothetical protein